MFSLVEGKIVIMDLLAKASVIALRAAETDAALQVNALAAETDDDAPNAELQVNALAAETDDDAPNAAMKANALLAANKALKVAMKARGLEALRTTINASRYTASQAVLKKARTLRELLIRQEKQQRKREAEEARVTHVRLGREAFLQSSQEVQDSFDMSLQVGDIVVARDRGGYDYPATVLEVSSCDESTRRKLLVHYNGWPSRSNEWITVGAGRLFPHESPREAASSWPSVKLKLGPRPAEGSSGQPGRSSSAPASQRRPKPTPP